METSFENYAEFCAHMQQFFFSNQQSLIDCWEKWDKNQALFEYLIRDTQADTEARMNAYEVLYYMLYPDKLPTALHAQGQFYHLPLQFDRKMIAKLFYEHFLTTKYFYGWGLPYFSPNAISARTMVLLGDDSLPLLYKALDNSNITPLFSPDWRVNDSEYKYRYADYACGFLSKILEIIPENAFFSRFYEERLPEIIKMKSIVQAYCAEKGISLE